MVQTKTMAEGLCAVLLPLLWPVLGMGLIYQVPASTPVVLILHYTVLPMHTAIMDGGTYFILEGLLLYGLRKNRLCRLPVFAAALLLEGLAPFLLTPGAEFRMLLRRCMDG